MVQSRSETLIRMTQMVLLVSMMVYNATYLQGQCNNAWTGSVLKSIGVQCLAFVLLGSVSGIFDYWNYSEKRRAKASGVEFKGTTAGKIADFIDPSSITGGFLALAVAYLLFRVFTKDCDI